MVTPEKQRVRYLRKRPKERHGGKQHAIGAVEAQEHRRLAQDFGSHDAKHLEAPTRAKQNLVKPSRGVSGPKLSRRVHQLVIGRMRQASFDRVARRVDDRRSCVGQDKSRVAIQGVDAPR